MENTQDSHKILVLIADDEVNLLLLLKDNLEEYGYQVVTATNGEEAYQKALSEKPDFVILDVEMPKLNGWQVCEKLRKMPEVNKVPILILSAYAQNEDIRKGLSAGANMYITKPFKVKDLIETIDTLRKQTGG